MRVKMKVTAAGHDYMDMCPDPELCAIFQQNWQAMGGEVPVTTQMPHGSLDMGNLSRRFPCVHASVRIVEDEAMAGHSREFAEATLTPFAEEQLLRAVRTLALSGADYLCG